jgi:hypothetical protein
MKMIKEINHNLCSVICYNENRTVRRKDSYVKELTQNNVLLFTNWLPKGCVAVQRKKGMKVLGKCGCWSIMVLLREMVWYMREMVGARKEGRKPSPPPTHTHTHSIHNRMLHLIQDVQKDASLQGAPGGGGWRGCLQ